MIVSGPGKTCVAFFLLAARCFRLAMLTTKKGIVIAACLVGCFRLHLRKLLPAAVFINCNKHEVSTGDVQMSSGLRIFDPDFGTNFK